MLLKQAIKVHRPRCRAHTTAARFQPVQVLPNADLETFRRHAFEPALPALLPRGSFRHLPAIEKWFVKAGGRSELRREYLSQYGDAIVPLEISDGESFARVDQPLSFFLDALTLPPSKTTTLYLAQHPLPSLPPPLHADLPTPNLILRAGAGDIYTSSLWLGRAPTYTPLHRDPNPNLFVQLAGKKTVRLLAPGTGKRVFSRVQELVGGGAVSAAVRGEEMMVARERGVLEEEVWGPGEREEEKGWEVGLEEGDGLFIPKGWWHSVKGVGEGMMTGSVNWWFR